MISVLCPTRGRMELAYRMQTSLAACSTSKTELLLWCDDDDPTEYETLDTKRGTLRTKVYRGTVPGVGAAWNTLSGLSRGDLVMMGNDDLIWKTVGWDETVESTYGSVFPDNLGVLWCDDGSGRGGLPCCFPIVSRLWCSALGQFVPECFHFLWHDTWVHDVGVKAGLTHYLPTVLIEHNHFTHGKSAYDDTYKRHREGLEACRKRQADQMSYGKLEPQRVEQARRIQSLSNAGKVSI